MDNSNDEKIEVEILRYFSIGEISFSHLGEIIELPKDDATRLAKVGKVRIIEKQAT
jgi:hypothetical protein